MTFLLLFSFIAFLGSMSVYLLVEQEDVAKIAKYVAGVAAAVMALLLIFGVRL